LPAGRVPSSASTRAVQRDRAAPFVFTFTGPWPREDERPGYNATESSPQAVLHLLREAGLPISSAWYNPGAALHRLTLAVRRDWHETTGRASQELVAKIADVVLGGPAAVHAPKTLVVEDDPVRVSVASAAAVP
jgi:hypothetical protein